MHSSVIVMAVLTVLVTAGVESVSGGWSSKRPESRPEYKELAHFAVAQRVEGLQNYDTILELTKVETQAKATCNAIVREKSWKKRRSLISFNCH